MKTVLIVGHYRPLQKIYEEIFEELGFKVIGCENGTDAERHFRTADIVFTDLESPGIDGTELAKRAKIQKPEMRVVIVADISGFVPEGHAADKVVEKRNVFDEIMQWLPEK